MNLRTLAESGRYTLAHEWEDVVLVDKATGTQRRIGDHYGDPKCGIIAPNEEWFLAGGEGLTYFDASRGVVELMRAARHASGFSPDPRITPDGMFIHSMKLEADGTVRILVDPWSPHASVWRFDPATVSVAKIHEGPSFVGQPWQDRVDY